MRVESDEANYMPTTNYMQVCLINIGNGIPYISALEIRRFESSIYPIQNGHFISLWRRHDFGGSDYQNYARYPQDKSYDRFWVPVESDELNSISTMVVTPQAVMIFTRYHKWCWQLLPFQKKTFFYLCLHFVEIEKLEDGQFRDKNCFEQ